MRRLLSLALSMAMVLSVLPAGALAEELVQEQPVQEELVQEPKTETCTHGNDPETCEACASAKKVAQVQSQIDALPGDVTAETKEAAQSALSAVDTAKSALTESEQAQLVMTRYTALAEKLAALESPAPSATGDTTEKTAKVISAWEWDDGYEIVDEESGYVVLPFTSEDFTSQLDDVKGMLPEAILVGEEALTLGNWTYETGEEGAVVTIDSESCPSPGIFKTTLPEGYVLADGTNVLSLTVALSAGSSEDTSSYADSDTLTNVPYYDANGTLKTCPSATKVVKNTDKGGPDTTWTTGWYVVEGTVEIGGTIFLDPPDWTKTEELYKSVSVQGDVNLILKQNSELQMLHGHIDVPKGSSLTVYCDNTSNSGTLKVWGAIDHAAIGGSPTSPDSGRITINGGTVTAHTGNGGAGIGSGEGGSAGDITINGGNIEAQANNGGAGIGTGKNGKSATITINNCEKIYCRANGGAVIGSGENSSDEGKVTVNIHGGKIDAYGRDGAGIGSGKNAPLSVTVNITGGDIYAQTSGLSNPASHGAAIGGGYGATNTTVNIGGSAEVDAHGGENAPGIGSIDPGGCSVTISGGTVRAWGGTYGAGIGGASNRNSCPVTITGGTVTAYGGNTGAGIGSGCGGNSTTNRYTTGNIAISGGTVTAKGGYFAAGIGGGEYNTAGEILISGGTVIATRDTSKDNDSAIQGGRFDIGDGFIFINNTPVYARYTLNGSAKLYLQNGFSNPGPGDEIKPLTNSGYIFNGTPETYTAIRVYGAQTLSENFCIETGKTMTVMSGASLNTGSNKLYVKGTLTKTGTASGNIYYPLTLTDCTATNTTTYQGSLFGMANATISLTPALQSGYKLDSWTVTPNTVTVSNNSFRMPEQATTVKAKGTQVLQITQQPEDKTITYGESATLSVTAQNSNGNTDGITYQWYKGTENLPNETSKTLSLRYLNASTQPYSFYCEVSCNGVSINSKTATVSGSGYPKIEYKLQSGSDTAYTTTAPTDAGSYTVRVTMSENQNYKGASATKDFTISKATDNAWQTEPSVTNFTYGDTVTNPVTYEAKYGNGNVVVTYKKQGTEGTSPITVPTDAGTYEVTVTLEETNNYNGLSSDPISLTISPKLLSDSDITVTATDLTYTGSQQSPTVTVKYGTITLEENTDYTLSGNTGTGAGTYTLTITGKGNFDGTTSKTWNITKAPITPVVSIANTAVYGETLNPSITGGNPGSGTVTYTYYSDANCTNVVTPKNVGTYYVKASVAQTANYQGATTDAKSFQITKKTLTVTANNKTITYGEVPNNSGVTYDGFVNGETENVLDGQLTYTYNYSQYGNVGSSYTITPGGLTSGNYDISFENGTLTVNKKEIGITWGDTQFTYNGSAQIPTATPTGMVNGDTITLTVSGAQTNAGTGYTATVAAINGAKAGNYALPNSVTTTFSIAQKEVTITGTTVEATKVYDGSTDAKITDNGTLNDVVSGDNLTIVPGGAAYDAKNVGENKPVTFSGFSLGGSAADNYTLTDQPASVKADITAKPVTLTVTVKDKDFDDTATAEIDAVNTNGFVEGDKVQVINGKPSFPQKTPGENLSVTFTAFTLEGEDAGNYSITNPQPIGVTGSILPTANYLDLMGNDGFAGQTEVWVDGVAYPIQTEGNCRYVVLPSTGDMLTGYTYQNGYSTPSHENYPTSMTVYGITRETTGATLARISAFDDLLRYSGCSIRITGKRGIRMITSLTKDNKKALKGAGLAGYTLEEYGTVVQWADELGDQSLTLSNGKSYYAYKRGKADLVFANLDDLTQYTNVLVWDSLTNTQLGQDIVMRPYIKLSKDGQTVTLYGGTVRRSIGYIAYQNCAVFKPGTAAYEYVWDIIHAVYGDQYDSKYQG